MTNQKTLITLLAVGTVLSFAASVSAANVTKADDTDNLNLGSSWVGGTAPGSADIGVWDGTITAARTNVLGQDATWAGIQILTPAGNVGVAPNVSGAALTVTASNPTLTYTAAPANPLVNGDRAFLTGTTAPTGFTFGINSIYYVVNATATTFQLSATPGGAAITPTTAGTAATVTGSILSLGASGVDTSGASVPLFLNCPVAITNFNGKAIWNLAQNVSLNSALIGTNALELSGSAVLTMNGNGGASNSTIQVDSGTFVNSVSGNNCTVALNGGTYTINNAESTPVVIMSGGGILQNSANNRTLSGAGISGSAPFTVNCSGSGTGTLFSWNCPNTNYTGTITLQGAGSLRLSTLAAVSAGTAYNFNNGNMTANATGIFNLGSLAGAGTLFGGAGQNYSIGALSANSDFSGVISGSTIIIKTGTGTQNLSGASTYGGITVISNGVLQIGNGGNAGSLASPSVFVTNSTSVLSFNRSDSALNFTNLVTGIGTISQDGGGTTFLSGPSGGNSANSYSGGTILNGGILKFAPGAIGISGITFNNGATLQWAAGNTTDISTNTVTITSGGGTVDVNGNTITLANPIGNSGTGALTVKSTGANGLLNLQGANTYSGGTTISSGTLRANNGAGSATGSGSVSVNGSATLGGAGAISGSVDVQGILAPGNSTVGTLTVGALTLEPASTNNFQFNATPANSGVVVTTSGGFIANGGLFNLYAEGGATPWTTPGTYHLVQFSGTAPSLDSSWTTLSPSNPHTANPQPGLQYSFSASGGFLSITISAASGAVLGSWNVDVNGNWSDGTKWSSNPNVPHAAADSATFGAGTALRTVTLDANESVGAITMSNNNSFVIASAGKTLTLDNSGSGASIDVSGGSANAIQTAVALKDNATVTTFAGKSLSISGAIGNTSTAKTLVVNGPGTLALSGNNSYGPAAGTAGTTLNGSILQLGNNNALGAGDVSVPANGTIRAGVSGLTVANNIDVATGVSATIDNNGNSLTLSGVISDGGNLTEIGNGTLTLSGTSTYSGNTTVNGGVLSLSADANVGSSPNVILNGGLLLCGTFELSGNHNIGVGLSSGTVGTNALIDAAGGQTFQVDGIIGSAGNSGANNLIVNSLPGDNGTLVLNGANTFNGTTAISNGVLELLNSLALQNSTLVYNSGTLAVNGGIGAVTFGGLTGSNSLYLTNLNGTPVTLTVGNNNGNTSYGGGLNDTGLGGALIKVGTGTLSLTGSNFYIGTTSARNGTLEINGGSLTASNTVVVGQSAFATIRLTNNGSIIVPATTVGTGGSGSAAGAIVVDSGTAGLGNITIGGTINGGSVTVNGGIVSISTFNDRRDASSGAATFNQGLLINGGSTTVSNLQLSTGNSGADLTVSNGTLTIGDPAAAGNFVVGTGNNGGRGGFLTVFGGALTYLGTDGLLLNNSNACQGTAAFNGGVSTMAGITMNNPAELTGGNAVLNINGGTVYLAGVGLVENTQPGGATASVNLTSGVLGATADWSSSAPMNVAGNFTIQAADTNGTAHNIAFSGVLSGNGGLTKTGAGTVTLSGANTYTNNTVVSSGTLDLLTASLFTNSTVSVSNGATLKLDFAGVNVVAGLILNGVSKPPGVYNHGTDPAFLAGSGSVQIIAIGPKPIPVITHIGVSGTTLTLTGTNGAPSGPFVLLQSTNILTPLTNWTPAVSNSFDAGGNLNLSTNIVNPANPRVFYILLQ
jgi:autotransporter-associated beta strand protein